MATIGEVYRRIAALDIQKISKASIDETKESIANINAEQLYAGKRSDGSDITPEYSDLTIELKKEKGQVTDRVTLKDTGDFYRGLRVQLQGDKVIIDDTDTKADKLFKKYATKQKNIYGLSGPYKREYLNEVLRKTYLKKMHAATGL